MMNNKKNTSRSALVFLCVIYNSVMVLGFLYVIVVVSVVLLSSVLLLSIFHHVCLNMHSRLPRDVIVSMSRPRFVLIGLRLGTLQ